MRKAAWIGSATIDRGTLKRRLGVTPKRWLPILVVLVLVLVTALPGSVRAEAPLSPAIPVGSLPGTVAVNPVTNRIYVANIVAASVSVIDGQTNTPLGPAIAIGQAVVDIAVNPLTNSVYVSEPFADGVAVIDGATNTLATTIPLPPGSLPEGVAVNPATNRIYVGNTNSQTVSVIDGATNTIIGSIPLTAPPIRVAVNSSTNRVYVTQLIGSLLTVIDGASNTVLTTLPMPIGPYGIAIDESTNRVYVAGQSSGTVVVLDGSTNAAIGAPIPVGASPNGIAVNPATDRVYVVNNAGNSVTAIDGVSATVLDPAVPVGKTPIGVAVNRTNNRIYVTNFVDSTISVLGVPLSATSGAIGADITAAWSNLSGPTGGDWVGLYPQGAPDGPPLSARFTNGTANPGGTGLAAGSVTLPVPAGLAPGQYEARLYANNNSTARLALVSVVIGQASLSVAPTTAAAGSLPRVSFGGIAIPSGGDWIGLYRQGAADPDFLVRRYTNGTETPGGSGVASGTLGLPLPSDLAPGSYEVRLYSNNSFQKLASTPLGVTRATLSADLSVVTPGQPVTVRWTGITDPNGGDAIGLYRLGAANTDAYVRRFTNGTEGSGGPGSAAGSLALPIPVGLTPGQYELRLLSGIGGGTLATTDVEVGVGIASCLPRPSVTTLTTPRGDHLDVTIVASALNPPNNNRLRELHFGQLQNARVTFNGQTVTSGQGITLTNQPTTLTFTVQRATPGQPTLAPFTVVDDCGSWPSFAGGGVDAGF
ncbi:MAG: YncE family protein [Chloroflexi bacterium]|nr:YncE family protein [Chloroflexota bacterium]